MSVFMQPIFTQTITTQTVSSVYFYNIPQGYTDLKVVVSARSTGSGNAVGGGFNLYNGYTYVAGSGTKLEANGSSVYSQRYGTENVVGASATANTFSNIEMYVPNYSGGNYKQAIIDSVTENNGTEAYIDLTAQLSPFTAPVTTVGFAIYSGNFAAGSTFSLYGISSQYATQTPIAPTITSITDQAGFASVGFQVTPGDTGTIYAVTDNNSNTTYGASSPIVAPATLGSTTTYTAKSINALGTTAAAGTASITSTNSYASIATVSAASGGSTSLTFTNIPQNYTHLQIRGVARNTSSANTEAFSVITFNGDTSNSYSSFDIYSQGSAVSQLSSYQVANAFGPEAPNDGMPSNIYAGAVIDILDYNNTSKYKSFRTVTGFDNVTAVGYIFFHGSVYSQFAPISSITLTSSGTAFKSGTTFSLYGIG